MTKYPKLKDYEGFEVALGDVFRFACCDCGLVHDMVLADEDNGKHGIAFKRHNRATAQLRRHHFGYLQQSGFLKFRMVKEVD